MNKINYTYTHIPPNIVIYLFISKKATLYIIYTIYTHFVTLYIYIGKWGNLTRMPGLHPYSSFLKDIRVAFYCGQPKAHLCNNHAV